MEEFEERSHMAVIDAVFFIILVALIVLFLDRSGMTIVELTNSATQMVYTTFENIH